MPSPLLWEPLAAAIFDPSHWGGPAPKACQLLELSEKTSSILSVAVGARRVAAPRRHCFWFHVA